MTVPWISIVWKPRLNPQPAFTVNSDEVNSGMGTRKREYLYAIATVEDENRVALSYQNSRDTPGEFSWPSTGPPECATQSAGTVEHQDRKLPIGLHEIPSLAVTSRATVDEIESRIDPNCATRVSSILQLAHATTWRI
jgi:hypothetical protein